MEKCFALNDDVIRLRDNEQCAAVTFKSIQKHLFEGHIHFSFLIKKNCKESLSTESLPASDKREGANAKDVGHSFANKGSMKSNNVRKAQSIPADVKPSAGGAVPAKKEPIYIEVEVAKTQPPDYSSINKINNQKQFTSPAHCTEALKRNDDELVGTNLSFT